jgi:hypothetical protein
MLQGTEKASSLGSRRKLTMSRKTMYRVCRRGSAGGRGSLRMPPFGWLWCVGARVRPPLLVQTFGAPTIGTGGWGQQSQTGQTTDRKWDGVMVGSLSKAPGLSTKKKN